MARDDDLPSLGGGGIIVSAFVVEFKYVYIRGNYECVSHYSVLHVERAGNEFSCVNLTKRLQQDGVQIPVEEIAFIVQLPITIDRS